MTDRNVDQVPSRRSKRWMDTRFRQNDFLPTILMANRPADCVLLSVMGARCRIVTWRLAASFQTARTDVVIDGKYLVDQLPPAPVVAPATTLKKLLPQS